MDKELLGILLELSVMLELLPLALLLVLLLGLPSSRDPLFLRAAMGGRQAADLARETLPEGRVRAPLRLPHAAPREVGTRSGRQRRRKEREASMGVQTNKRAKRAKRAKRREQRRPAPGRSVDCPAGRMKAARLPHRSHSARARPCKVKRASGGIPARAWAPRCSSLLS